ncbi:MAG TPA: alpha-glucosidase [Acidobacteriaceae bacterium]|nr:alpha-glucosidase [Acidobacteriaceae bacterium]
MNVAGNALRAALFLFLGIAPLSSGFAAPPPQGALPSTTAVSAGGDWWKHALIYEIYPRSFQDSDGNGLGDLNGITTRLDYLNGVARHLDYLKSLGVDAIWLTPIYPSPQVDFGYDISNYEAIDPQYGSMADFDRLLSEAKKRNLRIIMDMVMNHTSDKHPWFEESKSSRTNPKRNWYIWRDGKAPGVPPNNWQSIFGHSAWTFDPKTGQWYYHKFYAQQPDLNWRNPEVQRAMFAACRFWLNKGVAGFRLDAVPTLFEDPRLHDEKTLPGTNAFGDPNLDDAYTNNLPEVHGVIRALRKLVSSYPGDRVLIGETYLPNIVELRKWYGANHDELQLPMDLQVGFINKLDAAEFRQRIDEAERQLDGNQPLFVFDNHDNIRSWDRYGDGVHNLDIARVIAAILLGTRATAMMYYGEEIGMKTTPPTRVQDVKDPVGRVGWPINKGRDGERTPMQWDGSPNAGFTSPSATPWLPIPPSYKSVNVALESRDDDSLLNWYRQWISLRRANPALRDGALTMLNTDDDHVLSWLRQSPGGPAVIVACNFTAKPQTVSFDLSAQGVGGHALKTLIETPGSAAPASLQSVRLPPFGVYAGQVE